MFNTVEHMSEPRVGARLPKPLFKRLVRAEKTGAGQKTDILVTALDEFFVNHPTSEAQFRAVMESVRRRHGA